MEIIRISSVARERLSNGVTGFHLDRPQAASGCNSYDLLIEGWLIAKGDGPVEVQATHRGAVLRTTNVDLPRPDVVSSLDGNPQKVRPGFRMQVGVLGLPLEFQINLVAILPGGQKILLAVLDGSHTPLHSGHKPLLRPLMVTMQGRVGSTWLMRLLSEHPSLVIQPPHFGDPYETRAASYWLHMLKVLADPADHAGSSNRVDFTAKAGWVGHNPFFTPSMTEPPELDEWFGRLYPERLAEFCQQSIDDYYLRVAQMCGKTSPVFFAEKVHANHVPWIAWELYPDARELILVRDFRDMISSILAFNKKRGYDSFGRERTQSDLAYVESMRMNVLSFKRAWELRSDRAFLLRYEDLSLEPEATLERLLNYLGTPTDIQAMLRRAQSGSAELRNHRTTGDVKASIGRWKNDLEPELQEACSNAFEEALVAFGYA